MVFASVVSSRYKKIELNTTVFQKKQSRTSELDNPTHPPDHNTPPNDVQPALPAEESLVVLHKKERIALNLMLAMIRARSRENLK